jgi:hypothetical protein
MGQTALPVSDVSTGLWTPTPIWPQIGLAAPDDIHLVTSATNPNGDSFTVNLTPLAWPDQGAETLTVRLRQTAGGAAVAAVALLQGDSLIALQNFTLTTSFANYVINLTAAQIALITNYALLRVQVTTSVTVGCCPNSIEAALQAVITNGGARNGTYALLYNNPQTPGPYWAYDGIFGSCTGNNTKIELQCVGGVNLWKLTVANGRNYSPPASLVCSPLAIVFNGVNLSDCGGGINATVTVSAL